MLDYTFNVKRKSICYYLDSKTKLTFTKVDNIFLFSGFSVNLSNYKDNFVERLKLVLFKHHAWFFYSSHMCLILNCSHTFC